MRVSEATSPPRCHSPPRLGLPSQKVWPPAAIPPGNKVDHSDTMLPMSPDGKGAESLPSSTKKVCIVSAHGVTALCCLLEDGQSGTGKM